MTDNDSSNICTLFSLQGYAVKIVSKLLPPYDVEDIVQEAYVKAYQIMKRRKLPI
jgi:DNA-directed RNA polymerase specialized sigma24 family protein